jgi:hypothetical protein
VKTEFVGDFSGVHGVWQILLVGKDQEKGITEFILVQHALELFPSLRHTITIVRVDDENDSLCVLEVVPPEGTNLVLASDVPDGEVDVFVFDGFDIEA